MPVFTFKFEVYDCSAVNHWEYNGYHVTCCICNVGGSFLQYAGLQAHCSAKQSSGNQHRSHVNVSEAAEMVHTTSATRLVRNSFPTGSSFVVGQASSATIIPSVSGRRRNPTASSVGTYIPNASSDESMSLIVQLGTTVITASKLQGLDNSGGRNISLNYRDFQSTQRSPVIKNPNINCVINNNANNINCNMKQHQVIRQPVTIKPFHTSVKTVQPPTERRLENNDSAMKEEIKFKEEKGHTYPRDVQMLSEERRMEIVKFVLQDHNYGAPLPASPPVSPSVHGKLLNSAPSSGAIGTSSAIYQYGSGLLSLREAAANDDDANSVISSNPGREVEPEGEETETAPEGEGDDEDSVTRCICDFEHDDGYMICCDKCFVWQHVDCMGIDRGNIPDEYMCEKCQPRRVDRQRARTIQLRKREEIFTTDSSSDASSSSTDTDTGTVNSTPALPSKKRVAATTVSRRKSEPASISSKKSIASKQPRQRRESAKEQPLSSPVPAPSTRRSSTGQNRRKETTRTSTESKRTLSRRKSKNRSEDEDGPGAINQLRHWIDNYEEAVTNHYSPELRARISSIKVNGIHSDLKAGTLHSVSSGAIKCRVSQLAPGVRILVSTSLLSPNQPVIELRGKYMLSTQHRPPSLTLLNNRRARPSPGPFIFFYRLPKDGTEVCVDTRTYGNDARFVRRSCKPNAEVRHCIEKGILHLYIVTTCSIEKHAEITISHDGTQDVCACGNPKECTILTRRNGVHEPTERERRRRARRTTSSEDGESAALQSQPATVTTSSDGPPTRRNSATPRSPTKSTQQPPQEQETQQHETSESKEQDPSEATSSERQEKKRKLTREERKMEAIMKAFERLEKAEQRRQENQAKQANKKDHHDVPSYIAPKKESPPEGKRNSNAEEKEDVGKHHVKVAASDRPRRRRRKGRGRTTSLSQNAPLTQRRRTRLNSGDSDITSADESVVTSAGQSHSPIPSGASPHQASPVSTAAGLLLALANGNTPESPLASYQTPPQQIERVQRSTPPRTQGGVNPTLFCESANSSGSSTGSTPPTPLSSACLLVAAAVGPLAPGFKFPKTKKVLMNEWLNKSPPPPILPRPPSDLSLNPDSYGYNPHHSPTKCLATLAQAANRVSLGSSTSPTPHFSRGGGVGSAKKRWLRQAISEECDSPTANLCASPNSRAGSPPCPDYVAPLKKRRLARESMSSEQSFTPPTTPTMLADQQLSSSSPNSHKCPPYDGASMSLGGCEDEDVEEDYEDSKQTGEDVEERNPPELEEKNMEVDDTNTKESSPEEEYDEEPPSSPIPDVESESVLRRKVEDAKFDMSSEETEEEGCKGFEDGEGGNKVDSGKEQGCGSDSEVIDGSETEQEMAPPPEEETAMEPEENSKALEVTKDETVSASSTSATPMKRKLSISEYRQRKQRSTSTETKAQGAESDENPSGGRVRTDSTSSSSSLSSDDDTPLLLDNSPALSTLPLFIHSDGTDDKKGEETYMRWNSAPTLVERQRENLTERLRREFGLFLSDDEEQERARKQGLVQEVKDGKKKAPPPPPPPPLPPPPPDTASTQHMIPMYGTAASASAAATANFISPGGYPYKSQAYGTFPAGLGTKGKGSQISPVSAIYPTSPLNNGNGKKYLLATPPPPPPLPLPPSQSAANAHFIIPGPYGTQSGMLRGSSHFNQQQQTVQGNTSTFFTAAAAKAYYPPPPPPPPPPRT